MLFKCPHSKKFAFSLGAVAGEAELFFCGTQHVLPSEASAALTSVVEARGRIPFLDYAGFKRLLGSV